MSSLSIQKISITKLEVDAIVNAANSGLMMGGGVCGAIFREAGAAKLQAACLKIGGCKTGDAAITPGFDLPAKHVIHAVGPVWHGGNRGEPELLYSAYKRSLEVAKENGLHSIAFPLISAGIYGYPREQAWERALTACKDFIDANNGYEINIIFAVIDDDIMADGRKKMAELNITDKM
ncbi:MAG: macro domain-containing protein [Clostridiales bacterium]|jgi:O-acetyl-ADP-ribose deacetylase (regulator of RNase III)|nr:macro domain-containing protein [Clostridiales bacterium]